MKTYQHNDSDEWPFLNQDELNKCCEQQAPGATNQTQDCVGDWKLKLDAARWKMDKATADYDKANKTHTKTASWETKLKKWKEDTEEAHKKAVNVYDELDRFLKAVCRTKTEETASAVKAVLCLVKSIFDRVDDLLYVSSEEPKEGSIQKLKQWIECDDSLDANTKKKALDCISPFEEQMKDLNGAQEELLNTLLEILQTTNVLIMAVDKSGAEENAGIKWQLCDLKRRISGESDKAAQEGQCRKEEAPPQKDLPCKQEIVNPPKPLFPIRKMEDIENSKDSVYYFDIVNLYKKAEEDAEESKEQVENARKKRDDAVAYYNGLNDAIKAAEAAKPAK